MSNQTHTQCLLGWALLGVGISASGVLVGSAPGEADPTRTPLAEIPTPRRAHPRRRTAAKRKADELEQIENRPSGLVNRTVRDAARAETFAWDVNGSFSFYHVVRVNGRTFSD